MLRLRHLSCPVHEQLDGKAKIENQEVVVYLEINI